MLKSLLNIELTAIANHKGKKKGEKDGEKNERKRKYACTNRFWKGGEGMKILFFADGHGNEKQFEKLVEFSKAPGNEIDVFIYGGDLSPTRYVYDVPGKARDYILTVLVPIIRRIRARYRYLIFGNTDFHSVSCELAARFTDPKDLEFIIEGWRRAEGPDEVSYFAFESLIKLSPHTLKDFEIYDSENERIKPYNMQNSVKVSNIPDVITCGYLTVFSPAALWGNLKPNACNLEPTIFNNNTTDSQINSYDKGSDNRDITCNSSSSCSLVEYPSVETEEQEKKHNSNKNYVDDTNEQQHKAEGEATEKKISLTTEMSAEDIVFLQEEEMLVGSTTLRNEILRSSESSFTSSSFTFISADSETLEELSENSEAMKVWTSALKSRIPYSQINTEYSMTTTAGPFGHPPTSLLTKLPAETSVGLVDSPTLSQCVGKKMPYINRNNSSLFDLFQSADSFEEDIIREVTQQEETSLSTDLEDNENSLVSDSVASSSVFSLYDAINYREIEFFNRASLPLWKLRQLSMSLEERMCRLTRKIQRDIEMNRGNFVGKTIKIFWVSHSPVKNTTADLVFDKKTKTRIHVGSEGLRNALENLKENVIALPDAIFSGHIHEAVNLNNGVADSDEIFRSSTTNDEKTIKFVSAGNEGIRYPRCTKIVFSVFNTDTGVNIKHEYDVDLFKDYDLSYALWQKDLKDNRHSK